MYNRYIPQADGTYRRNRMPDRPSRQNIPHQPPQNPTCSPAAEEAPDCAAPDTPVCKAENRTLPQRHPLPQKRNCDNSISGFLKQILPSNFDTGDLLVVLLLLLMSGECGDDQNTALLTLALYLFL